jgi:hypothetical protein
MYDDAIEDRQSATTLRAQGGVDKSGILCGLSQLSMSTMVQSSVQELSAFLMSASMVSWEVYLEAATLEGVLHSPFILNLFLI